jgi:DHA1 family bicyclomycin/chloramphenicol resistance-like MFS transporter
VPVSSESAPPGIGFGEFVALMATLTALVALSIDMILPALPAIGASLGVARANDNQLVISLFFFGFAFGQMFYGPISDNTGRKPAVYVGLSLYIGGCLLALLSRTFTVMLAARFLQGVGVAGPRTITIALLRDKFEGRAMARVMSLIMTIFILVPVIAPSLGQGLLAIATWRAIFGVYLTMAIAACVWFALRHEETLALERRIPFSIQRIAGAFRMVATNRVALGHTLAAGCMFGAFLGYLSSAQQILQQQYGLGARFPLYFAMLALAIGTASFLNARLVMRHGMRRLSLWSLQTLAMLSLLFLGIAFALSGHPPLWALLAYLLLSFFCVGLLFGNLNALAMQPLGQVAGTGAAVVGSLATTISLPLGTAIGQSYNGTIVPLVAGFAALAVLARVAIRWAEGSAET